MISDINEILKEIFTKTEDNITLLKEDNNYFNKSMETMSNGN